MHLLLIWKSKIKLKIELSYKRGKSYILFWHGPAVHAVHVTTWYEVCMYQNKKNTAKQGMKTEEFSAVVLYRQPNTRSQELKHAATSLQISNFTWQAISWLSLLTGSITMSSSMRLSKKKSTVVQTQITNKIFKTHCQKTLERET